MTIKELISKLSTCKSDWNVELIVNFTLNNNDFYIRIDKKKKMYKLIQGVD